MIWLADPDCPKCRGNTQYEDRETLYTCDCGHEVVDHVVVGDAKVPLLDDGPSQHFWSAVDLTVKT